MPVPTASIITQPSTYSMINDPLWFRTNSTASSLTNFQYIYDVFTYDPTAANATQSNLGRYLMPPRPVTGESLFTPNDILKSEISYDLNPFIPYTIYATNSIVQYATRTGLQFNPGLTFGVYFGVTSSIFPTGSMEFALTTPMGINNFEVGDIITIDMDNKQLDPSLNGTASVLAVIFFFADIILTDKPLTYTGVPINSGGTITNITRMNGTVSQHRYALNGTRQYTQNNEDFGSTYLQRSSIFSGGTWNNYLSNFKSDGNQIIMPNSNGVWKQVFLENYETTSYLVDRATVTYGNYNVITFDNNFNTLQVYTFSANLLSSNYKRVDVVSGPKNLIALGVSFSNVGYYYLTLSGTSSILDFFSVRGYQVVCNPSPYQNVRVAFQNSLGAFDYWNFNWKSKKTFNMSRTEFKKVMAWNYNIGDRGTTILGQKVNETFTISTDFLTDYEYEFLAELAFSTEAYIIDEINQEKIPIIITETTYEVKTRLNDQILPLSISFKYAFDRSTQSL